MTSNSKNFYDFRPTREPGQHYTADAAIVWCFDCGFFDVLTSFVKERGWRWEDVVTEPGGIKTLVSPVEESYRESLLWRVRSSLKLHQPTKIILMLHSDCGAYGGLKAFGDDTTKEKENHEKDLRAAKEYLESNLPIMVNIEMWFAGFDGLHRVE